MIDPAKTYQTRSGLPVRILCIDGPSRHPVIGIIGDGLCCWLASGRMSVDGETDFDLIEKPREIEVEFWVNVYPSGTAGTLYRTRKLADEVQLSDRIACLHIKQTVTEGFGLTKRKGLK